MQTFMPLPSYESVNLLDMKRLGKQRVEAWQIVQALTGESTGWVNHPATKMWRNHVGALCNYGMQACRAWIARGYKDTLYPRFQYVGKQYDQTPPCWLGRSDFHASHRAALMRKKPEFYSNYGWLDTGTPYVWPSPCDCKESRIKIPEPVLVEYRLAFAIMFYDNILLANVADSAVRALGHKYRGGYYDGMACQRASEFDRVVDGVQLYAVTMSG